MPRAKVTVSIKALKSGGLDKLRDTAKQAAERIRAAEKALSDLNTTSKTTSGSEKAIDSSSRSYDKLSKTLNSTSNTAKRAQDSLNRSSSGIQATSKAANRLNQSFTMVDAAALSISNSLGRSAKALKRQKTVLQENSRTVDNAIRGINRIRVGFGDASNAVRKSIPEIKALSQSLGSKFSASANTAAASTAKWGVSVFRTLTGLDAAEEKLDEVSGETRQSAEETAKLARIEKDLIKTTEKLEAKNKLLTEAKNKEAAASKAVKEALKAEKEAKKESTSSTAEIKAAEKALNAAKRRAQDLEDDRDKPARKVKNAEERKNEILKEQNRLKSEATSLEKQLALAEAQRAKLPKSTKDLPTRELIEEADSYVGELSGQIEANLKAQEDAQTRLKNSSESLADVKDTLRKADRGIARSQEDVLEQETRLTNAREAAETASANAAKATKIHSDALIAEKTAKDDTLIATRDVGAAEASRNAILKEATKEQQKAVKGSKTAEQAQERLAKATQRTASANTRASVTAQGLHERNRGLGKVTNNSSRQFASLSEGIVGGIVPAYAALAANIFAVSAAFEFLRKAGDLVTLNRGQVIYASSTGKAIRSLTQDVIAATDAQVTYEDAAQATAIGLASGLNPDQLVKLGTAARDVSVVLGRDVTDSFNRLVRGVTKAEPELLDELGIVLRLKEATTTYAAALGLGAEDLNAYQRSQAVANDVLTQAEEKYGRILKVVDPVSNSFRRLGVAFDESFRSLRRGTAGLTSGIAEILVDFDKLRNALAIFAGISLLNFSSNKGITRITGNVSDLFGKFTRGLVDSTAVSAKQFEILGKQARKTGIIIRGQTRKVREAFDQAERFGLRRADRGSLRDRVARGGSVGVGDIASIRKTRDAFERRAREPYEKDGVTIYPGLRTEALRKEAQASADKLTKSMKRLEKTGVTTFQKVQQRGFQALTGLSAGFKSLGVVATGTFTLMANGIRLLTLAAPYLAIGFTAITLALAAFRKEKVLTEKEKELEYLAEQLKNVNVEFEKFNQIQRILAEEGQDSLRFINAFANRIGSISIPRLGVLFDEIEEQLPDITEKEIRRLTARTAGLGGSFTASAVAENVEGQTVGEFFAGSNEELLKDFQKEIQEQIDAGKILDEYYAGSSQTISAYLETLKELNNENIGTGRFRELGEQLAQQRSEVDAIRDSTNQQIRLTSENTKLQDRVLSKYIAQSDEATLVKNLETSISLIKERQVDQGGKLTDKQKEEIRDLERKVALFKSIDEFNYQRELKEKRINRLAAENQGLLTPTQDAREQLIVERRNIELQRDTASERIRIIQEVGFQQGRLNEQQRQQLRLAQMDLALSDTQLTNLEKRERSLFRTQATQARFNQINHDTALRFDILSANQTGRVKERLDVLKDIAESQNEINRITEEHANLLTTRLDTTQGYNQLQTEEEKAALRLLDTAKQRNKAAERRLKLLDREIRNERRLRRFRENLAIDRELVRGPQIQHEGFEFVFNREELLIAGDEIYQEIDRLRENIAFNEELELSLNAQIQYDEQDLAFLQSQLDFETNFNRNIDTIQELNREITLIENQLNNNRARVDEIDSLRHDLASAKRRQEANEEALKALERERDVTLEILINQLEINRLRQNIEIDRQNVRGTQFQRDELNFGLDRRQLEADREEINREIDRLERDIEFNWDVMFDLSVNPATVFDDINSLTNALGDAQLRGDVTDATIRALEDERALNLAILRIEQRRDLERSRSEGLQFQGPRARLTEEALSDFEIEGVDLGQIVHGQGRELLTNQQHAILDFESEIRSVQQAQLDTLAEKNKIYAAAIQSNRELTEEDKNALAVLRQIFINQNAQEAQIKRNQAATQALLVLENKRLEALGKQNIRNAAAEVATTANQKEILDRANRLHEIREQALLLQEEINLLESDLIKNTASEETEEQLQARRDELTVLLLQEQALERQINLTTQLVDTIRNSLESNVQSGIASFLKGEESSVTDLIRTIGTGVLESAADNLSKSLTNILFGNEQDKIAERQAAIIEGGMRDAADYHADRIRSAVDDTIDADTMSPITVDEFVAGRGGIAEVLENIDSGFTGLFNDLKIGLDNILGNVFSNSDFLSAIFGFRNGGIASGGFRAFANGGVIDRPTVGIVGEGRYNEAVVPLPDGKSIPVETRGMSGPTNVNVNVYVSNDGSATSETEGLNPGALGDAVAGAVQREIQKQKRPGGMLNKYGVA